MRLSRESHYGLLALVHLANAGAGTILQAAELARQLRLSPSFLAKVVQKLAAAGILRSYRGRVRGYALAGPASAVSARAVIEAIDPEVFTNCVFSSDRCSELRPCLLHPVWKTVRPQVSELLANVSVADLARGRQLSILLPRLELVPGP